MHRQLALLPVSARAMRGHKEVGDVDLVLTPRLSMMGGASRRAEEVGAWVMGTWLMRKIDFTGYSEDDPEEPLTGWCKVVPRGLRFSLFFDVVSLAALVLSRGAVCDQPLRMWLLGGIALGYPTSWLIQKIARKGPWYSCYRLKVRKTRGGGSPEEAQLGELQIFDRMGMLVESDRATMREQQGHFFVDMRDGPTLVTSYSIVTASRAPANLDPVSWTFEGSTDGVEWDVLDEQEDVSVPAGRGQALPESIDELNSVYEAAYDFRTAWFAEVVATAAAFVWLVKGTGWVGLASNECLDAAPGLFYPSWLLVVLTWSLLGSVTMMLIISAVAVVVTGQKPRT